MCLPSRFYSGERLGQMVELIGAVIALIIVSICFGANFYLFSQWLVYSRLRRRFHICKPYLLLGWVLYIIGGAVIRQIGRVQHSDLLTEVGNLVAFIGLGLTVYAATRLLRANAAERRATRSSGFNPVAGRSMAPAPKPTLCLTTAFLLA